MHLFRDSGASSVHAVVQAVLPGFHKKFLFLEVPLRLKFKVKVKENKQWVPTLWN